MVWQYKVNFDCLSRSQKENKITGLDKPTLYSNKNFAVRILTPEINFKI